MAPKLYWILFFIWFLFAVAVVFLLFRRYNYHSLYEIPGIKPILVLISLINCGLANAGPFILQNDPALRGGLIMPVVLVYLLTLQPLYNIIRNRATQSHDGGMAGFMKHYVSISTSRGNDALEIVSGRILRNLIIGQILNVVFLIAAGHITNS